MAFNPEEHFMNLKGKNYLEVKWRLVWFREKFPEGTIHTEHITLTSDQAIFRAVIHSGEGGQATGYGSETPKDFRDYIEKAETKAVGRALAMLGFGTQFDPDLDEEHRIVDAPVERQAAPQQPQQPAQAHVTDKQLNFIRGLWKDLGYITKGGDGKPHHDHIKLDQYTDSVWQQPVTHLNASQATQLIDTLQQLKKEKLEQEHNSLEMAAMAESMNP